MVSLRAVIEIEDLITSMNCDIEKFLPTDVTFSKNTLPDGGAVYTFWHEALGKLGRLLVSPFQGTSYVSCEPEEGADTETGAEKLKCLTSIAQILCAKASSFLEKQESLASSIDLLHTTNASVATRIFTCSMCNTPVAMIIHAPGVTSTYELEKYAKTMYAQIVETNLPTWVVGEEQITEEGDWQAFALKVWPERGGAAHILSSQQMKLLLNNLQKNHCK